MKKFSMLFLSLLFIFLATGCGKTEEKEAKDTTEEKVQEQTLVCTSTTEDANLDIEQVISMNYKNDKLKSMKMEVNTTAANSAVKEKWEEYKKAMDENYKPFDKDGISLKIVVDDQNYKYNTILEIDLENATEEALKEQGFEGAKEDDSTIEESKAEAEKGGATCIIK